MRRLFSIILVFVLCVSMLSCHKSVDYRIRLADSVLEDHVLFNMEKFSWDTESLPAHSASETMTVIVNGKQYTGRYDQEQFEDLVYKRTFVYRPLEGDNSFNFFTVDENGNLFRFASYSDTVEEGGEKLTEKKIIALAKSVLSEHTEHVERYTPECQKMTDSENRTTYIISMMYQPGGMKSFEGGYFEITENGKINSFHLTLLGELSEGEKTTFDLKAVENLAKDTIREQFTASKNGKSLKNCEVTDMRLTVLPDGEVGVICITNYTFPQNGTDMTYAATFVVTET